MALRSMALVIADISDYTGVIRNNHETLEHAPHPLRLEKLVGEIRAGHPEGFSALDLHVFCPEEAGSAAPVHRTHRF